MEEKELYKEKVELLEVELDSGTKDFTHIDCPSCQNPVPADHININDKIAKCGHCAVVFNFDKKVKALTTTPSTKQNLPRPEGIDIFEFKNEIDIEVKQPAVPVEILPFVFLPIIFVFSILLYFKNDISGLWLGVSFLLNVVLLFYLYKREQHKVNIQIDERELNIDWRPKKLMPTKKYLISDIKQFYVKQNHVFVIVDGIEGSKHVNLIPGLNNLNQAHFLEQELERYLQITDTPIIGEDKSS